MNAAIVDRPNATPRFGIFREPGIEAGRTIVELVATGIHPIVRKAIAGEHYLSDGRWPAIPGVDAVARTTEGALVYTGYARAPFGTIADRISVPAQMMLPLPTDVDPTVIAAGLNPGLSSWPILATVGDLDLVIVAGATGSAGRLAVQNARILGARRIVAIGRNPDALATLAGDAVAAIALTGDRKTDSGAIAAALGEFGTALILDYVWGSAAEAIFAALMDPGLYGETASIRHVQIGDGGGSEARVPAQLLRSRPIEIVGSGAGSVSIVELMKQLPVYVELLAAGKVTLDVETFPLNDIATAWESERSGVRTVITHSV